MACRKPVPPSAGCWLRRINKIIFVVAPPPEMSINSTACGKPWTLAANFMETSCMGVIAWNSMAKLIILILTFCVTPPSNGQTIDTRIRKEIDILRQSHIDTFLIYSVPCVGCETIVSDDTCSNEEQSWYLLWKKSTIYYLQKFDFCKNYKPVLLDTLNALLFISCTVVK